MAMERYVYVLNSDKYSNENIPYSFDTKNRAFALNQAFTNTSVNPIIKSTNITEEYNGVSANFFEIRSGPYDGMISADNSNRIVNRIYPTANATDITAYAKNRQQTRSYKIRTYSSISSETHNSKVIGSGGLDINLDNNDYFVLINPEIDHTETDGTTNSDTHSLIRPHFAKITQIISYDTYGDGFEFEPKYTGPISKDTNFEIYEGPLTTETDVVAVSYGLRGDGNEINPETTDDTNFEFITDKYDASNQVSKPTWYFYNDRLQNKDQLDYDTKYNLTTCRWFSDYAFITDGYTSDVVISQQQVGLYESDITLGYNNLSASDLIIGSSVFIGSSKSFLGNIKSVNSGASQFTIDYNRYANLQQGTTNLRKGRTIHQTVFRTEREYGDEIQDLGPKNQHATLVDNIHTKDAYFNDQLDIGNNETLDENQAIDYEESSDLPASSPAGQYTFNPSIWKDAFRNFRRTTNDLKSSASGYTTAGTISTLHANLTGPKRYLYYKSSHLKNNAVIPVTELRVNNPKEKISQIARIKTLDGSGIQFLKLKEDDDLVVTKSIHTNTLKEFKLPYYVNSSYDGDDGHSIVLQQIPDTEVSYPTISVNDILRVNDTYYRVVDKGPEINNKIHLYVSHKKLSNAATWSALSSESDMETFTGADVYVMAWNGGLNSSCPIDSEGVYASNSLQRLTMHGNTISLKDNSLYNKKISLLNPEFYGHDITINYGDSLHNHIKLKSTKKFYQPDSERIDFMYYYNGNYAIEEEAFNGTIEDIESSSSEGMLTYTITGRDKTSILLNNLTNNNLNKTDDIVLSSLAPVFDAPLTTAAATAAGETPQRFTPSNSTNPITFLSGTGNNTVSMAGMAKYDLLFNDDGVFLGEVDTKIDETIGGVTIITVTLKGYTGDFPAPKVTQNDVDSILLVKLTDANYLSGTKALAANLDASKYPTDYSSIGEKGLVFHDGEKITYSSSFAYNNLLNTSSIGSFTTDRTIGYDITDVKGIVESYDSNFAFKLANEKKASIDYNSIHTTAMSNYDVVDFDSHDTGVTLKIAPKFPIVLGSIDTNASDNTWGTDMRYLYLVNSNIPNGGFIHTIQDNNGADRNHTDYYTPYKTFRYWGMQRFKEGSIEETYDSIYNDNSKTQRITAAAPMYKINGLGTKLTPNDNTSVDTDLTPSLISKHGSNLWTQSHLGLTDREEPKKFGITATEVKAGTYHTFTQLENIDYRAKNYELLAIGDIYPDSKLRWNNIQAQTKDFSTYGMILESAGSEGKSISHENFTGTTNNTNTSDSNYERIEITSSNKTTNQLKRFGIMRLVEATFDWHMNPVDYESTPQPKDPYKINLTKYPRMKMISSNNYIESYTYGNDSSLELHDPVTFEVGDNVYDSEGELLAVISSASTTVYIVHADLLQYVNLANRLSDKIYVMRPKTFDLFADPDWGINTQGANDMKMLHNYLVVPGVDKNYFSFGLLEYDPTNPLADEIPYDAQNIFIPIICKNLKDQVDDTLDVHVWYSLFHEAKHWDSGTSSPIWYHPSRLIYALAYPTTQDDSPETGLRQDGIQYKISNAVDLYGESIVLFKDMHTSTKNNESSFKLPTSGVLGPGTYGGLTQWAGYLTEIANDRADQRAVNVTQQILGSAYGYDYTICGPKTIKHIYAEDGNRNWTRSSYHSRSTVDDTGQLFQAQTFIKPRLILTSANTDLSVLNITLGNASKNNWLDFVPDLTGYYLVSDKMGNKYLPSNDNASNHAVTGTPDYIGKITEHTIDTDSGGDFPVSRHTLKLDKTLNTSNVGTAFRLMKISETTFEDTPDYFEVNKMFDTGLKYDALHQNFVTGVEEESGSELDTTEYLAYQQGLYAMYLLLDIDTINSYPDRRTLTDADDLFSDGDSLNCWITDGNNSIEKNILVSRVTGSKLRFSYDGALTGYGVVSFGETFTIETPQISKVRNPKTAYIGATFSIGTDAELAIEEILEENGIQVDTSEKQLNYTSNIVNVDTTASVIDIVGTLVDVEEGEIIYNQDGKLIGKVAAAVGGADITIEDIFYKPVKNDEITKYSRKPHILNTNFTDQDVFSAINYLAAKKSLDYNFDEDKIKIRDLDNYNTHRKFALKYRDGTNLISVDSNTSLFDKASKIIVIGDNVKAEVEEPAKKTRTIKHIDSNIKNSQEARIKAYALLELHNKPSRKINLTLEKTGFELMKAGDLISLDFPNHNIPADDYIVFEIENVMSNIAKITVGTFNKTIAERLSELGANQGKGFTNLFSKNTTKTLTAKVLFDDIKPKEQSLNCAHKTTIGGTTFGFI